MTYMEIGNWSCFFSFFLLDRWSIRAYSLRMDAKQKEKIIVDVFDEPLDHAVNATLGKTHFEALKRWSKKQFGIVNCAAFMRMLINDRLEQERKASDAASH